VSNAAVRPTQSDIHNRAEFFASNATPEVLDQHASVKLTGITTPVNIGEVILSSKDGIMLKIGGRMTQGRLCAWLGALRHVNEDRGITVQFGAHQYLITRFEEDLDGLIIEAEDLI